MVESKLCIVGSEQALRSDVVVFNYLWLAHEKVSFQSGTEREEMCEIILLPVHDYWEAGG